MVAPPRMAKATESSMIGIKGIRMLEMEQKKIAIIARVFLPYLLMSLPPTIPPIMPPAVPRAKIAPPTAGDTLNANLKKETM